MMRVVGIIQARMGSTRLPGKVLRDIGGQTMLAHVVQRAQGARTLSQVVVATTISPADDAVVAECERLGVAVFRGDEEDVLARYYWAAKAHQAEAVVRITSDCPLIDPQVIDNTIQYFLERQERCDYVANWKYEKQSNTVKHTYPLGMSVEVFTMAALQEAYHAATAQQDREHVTPFFYTHPERFRVDHFDNEQDLGGYRWTVDTPEDIELVRRIIECLCSRNSEFTLHDVLTLFKLHPEWLEINRHIQQTKLNIY
jgi:spore coat polysaccharide biosynthesis protein SpsF